MKPQIVNAKMNRMFLRSRIVKISVLAAIVFSMVMMTGYSKFQASVFITDNGVTKEVKTNESDVYEILRAENYTLGDEDRVTYTKDDNDEGHITIHRAFNVMITADGDTRSVTVIGGTVADILEKANIKLSDTDKVTPELDAAVDAETKIEVTRVRYLDRTVNEEIPFETEYQDDPNIKKGVEEELTAGETGVRAVKMRDTYINNKLEKTERVSDTVTKQPVTRVVKRGTAVVSVYNKPLGAPYNPYLPDYVELENGVPKNYVEKISNVKSTAYNAPERYNAELGQYVPIPVGTASGRKAQVGVVAVNPNDIPYGSELYIVSPDGTVYGYAIAADTGLGMMDGTVPVDVFMASIADACKWGVHYVDIYILSVGNG